MAIVRAFELDEEYDRSRGSNGYPATVPIWSNNLTCSTAAAN